ncbi:MAG: hypothetical protein AB7F94_02335 [Nitrospira sp.]
MAECGKGYERRGVLRSSFPRVTIRGGRRAGLGSAQSLLFLKGRPFAMGARQPLITIFVLCRAKASADTRPIKAKGLTHP